MITVGPIKDIEDLTSHLIQIYMGAVIQTHELLSVVQPKKSAFFKRNWTDYNACRLSRNTHVVMFLLFSSYNVF